MTSFFILATAASEIYRFPKNIFPWKEVKNGKISIRSIASAKSNYVLVKNPLSLEIKGLDNLDNDEDKNMVKEKVAEELIDKLLSDSKDFSDDDDYIEGDYGQSDTSVIELDQSMEPGQFFEIMVKEIDDETTLNRRHKREFDVGVDVDVGAFLQEKDDEQSTIGFNVRTQNGKSTVYERV